MKVLTVFGTAHNLGWPSTQTGQVYWLYNDSVHLCFKDCHPRSLYNLWCVGVGSSQQLLGALSSSLLRLQCCDGVAAHMPPPAWRLCPASQLHRLPWTPPTGRAADSRLCRFLEHHMHPSHQSWQHFQTMQGGKTHFCAFVPRTMIRVGDRRDACPPGGCWDHLERFRVWCLLDVFVFLHPTLNWNKSVPCLGLDTAVVMSPASAATASESSTSPTTVPAEESPRREVRTRYFQSAG